MYREKQGVQMYRTFQGYFAATLTSLAAAGFLIIGLVAIPLIPSVAAALILSVASFFAILAFQLWKEVITGKLIFPLLHKTVYEPEGAGIRKKIGIAIIAIILVLILLG